MKTTNLLNKNGDEEGLCVIFSDSGDSVTTNDDSLFLFTIDSDGVGLDFNIRDIERLIEALGLLRDYPN